jgi:hypothetical protein
MACGCAGRKAAEPISRAESSARAVQAGSFQEYEVLNARGQTTGRKFTSLVAASGYASRIGGSTRPV